MFKTNMDTFCTAMFRSWSLKMSKNFGVKAVSRMAAFIENLVWGYSWQS
jgi:formylmethanofuran dehydrogenase subunit A